MLNDALEDASASVVVIDSTQAMFPSQWRRAVDSLSEDAKSALYSSPRLALYCLPTYLAGARRRLSEREAQYNMLPPQKGEAWFPQLNLEEAAPFSPSRLDMGTGHLPALLRTMERYLTAKVGEVLVYVVVPMLPILGGGVRDRESFQQAGCHSHIAWHPLKPSDLNNSRCKGRRTNTPSLGAASQVVPELPVQRTLVAWARELVEQHAAGREGQPPTPGELGVLFQRAFPPDMLQYKLECTVDGVSLMTLAYQDGMQVRAGGEAPMLRICCGDVDVPLRPLLAQAPSGVLS
jgi:hypothetical protein